MREPGRERRARSGHRHQRGRVVWPQETPRNGNFTFDALTSVAPVVPNTPTCPNAGWTATVVDVTFTSVATLTLTEDGVVSDTLTVAITD